MKIFSFRTTSAGETMALGNSLMKSVSAAISCSVNENVYVKLIGGLGSGKTTFVKGFTLNSKSGDSVKSPTFNILKIYELPKGHCRGKDCGSRSPMVIYHVDLYRLKKGVSVLEFFEPLKGNGIWLIEWADKLPPKIFHEKKTIEVEFFFPRVTKKMNERVIKIKSKNSFLKI